MEQKGKGEGVKGNARFYRLNFTLSPLPFPLFFIPKLPKGSVSRLNRLVDDRCGVGVADKASLKLGRGKINAFIKHRVEEFAVELSVAVVGSLPICDGLVRKECRPH
jgi:hypothetical protein